MATPRKPASEPLLKKAYVVSPSAPCPPAVVKEATQYLKKNGWEVELQGDPTAGYGDHSISLFSTAQPEDRFQRLNQAVTGGTARLILSARGGYGAMELLPLLKDLDPIPSSTPIMGYSDTTALLVPLAEEFGAFCIHGPALISFRDEVPESDREAMFKATEQLFCGEKTLLLGESLELLSGGEGEAVQGDKVEAVGPLLGGNLTIFTALFGTPWQPDTRGKILFFEECNNQPYQVHRMLLQLSHSGAFHRVSGVVLGDFSSCVHPERKGPTVAATLADFFSNFPFPVFSGAPFGHISRNLPIPLGLKSRASCAGLELLETPVQYSDRNG